MTIDIGIPDAQREAIANRFAHLLADSYTQWCVPRPAFSPSLQKPETNRLPTS